MGCANGKWLGVFNRFTHAEHESELKSCPSRIVFEKMGVETPQKGVFGHFLITMDTKHRVLEPSKMLWISFCSNPKTPWTFCDEIHAHRTL